MNASSASISIGVGLPAAVPGAPAAAVGSWAAEAERLGFRSVGVLDRLVYDCLDPLVALAAAAERTERVELLTTVLTVPSRQNAIVLAKQLAGVELLSGGRLTGGLALGGWPEDYVASGVPTKGRGAVFDAMLATMSRVWAGELAGAGGPIPALPEGRPRLLFGGFAEASFTRAARLGDGWVAPFFGADALADGIAGVHEAWARARRPDRPRIVVERYFCLGRDAERTADDYLLHYYGPPFVAAARADTLTSSELIAAEVERLADAGCDDLLLFPCSGELEQLRRLADALELSSR
ncbi:MAG TPA: LLM class flavin-dependent oxidoreductase [Conexibacter sp.]